MLIALLLKKTPNYMSCTWCTGRELPSGLLGSYMLYWESVTFWSVRELHGVLGECYLLVCWGVTWCTGRELPSGLLGSTCCR